MSYSDGSCWICFWQAPVLNLPTLSGNYTSLKDGGKQRYTRSEAQFFSCKLHILNKLKFSYSCFCSFDTCLSIFFLYIVQFFLLWCNFFLQLSLSNPCFLFFPLRISKDVIKFFLQICKAFPQNIIWIPTSERQISQTENSDFKLQYQILKQWNLV